RAGGGRDRGRPGDRGPHRAPHRPVRPGPVHLTTPSLLPTLPGHWYTDPGVFAAGAQGFTVDGRPGFGDWVRETVGDRVGEREAVSEPEAAAVPGLTSDEGARREGIAFGRPGAGGQHCP